MSPMRSSPRWPTACSMLLLVLASKAVAVYGETITVNVGGKIQDALDEVQPGDTIEIESGEYYENIRTTVDGTPDQRIAITAAGGSSNKENVIIRGGGESTRIFEVNHDYYTIESFTIDGENLEVGDDEDYTNAYRDKLLYVVGTREPTMRDGGYLSALDGLIVTDMALKNAGGECLRIRYFVTYAEIYNNKLEKCGLYDFLFDEGGKNGEGIYMGTSNNQWDDGKNPTNDPDVCMGNHIHDNAIRTEGNEGVEVKEGSIDNIIEDNEISLQLDADSGGICSRGDRTIIRNNRIVDASGAGVRLGGALVDGTQYGVDNEVYGNTMEDCRAYGVKIMASPQGQVCGNDIELPDGKDDNDYAYSGGTYADAYDPREECDSNPGPSPTSPTPSTTSSTPSPTPLEEPRTSPTPSPTGSTSYSTSTSTSTSTEYTPSPTEFSSSVTTEYTPSPTELSSSTFTEYTPSPTEDFGSDIEYLGCFRNHGDGTSVEFLYRDSEDMTNEDCIENCRDNGSSYAGTSRGIRCGCADTIEQINNNGESKECLVPCSGDDSEMCGGHGVISTWKI